MRNKLLILLAMTGLLTFLSGCMDVNQEITSDSTGFWNEYIVFPLSKTLLFFADAMNGSYGLAIIVVTIIIRLLLLPLNVKQLKSSKAMQDIQPELKELREKYSSKDAQTQQKLQQETMQLFQKNGVNPLAGCLPIIVQMPILIGFYHAIMRTTEVQTHNFLWLELGQSDPFLAILTAGTTFLQQKLMMAGGAAAQNPQMQMMLYVMPLMIGTFAFFFPSALALYWIVGNIVMILQTIFIRKPMMKDETGGAN
ncbi:protein translocase subunit yidC [Halobacillus karajensis]|uniref:Membrane protein insertase YidC n=1 Tax=Halobacillus karajensis TaxID=195088 RepID=A0A059NXM2_9BACI|nr:YidC family membrane integrase SpoIIIJ [Halobacillus karajensis]CDQ18393.1 Stage III sporulation protein J [Halobacillus karajensis]CDQ23535.1 Stage III sporulation protein J [Halobacillus karajensis]CDQ27017.1 Stage III sporulation protein J [Halobacillus karajensis]SEH52023.1 protein translocase subunit yidC [Halobacillus karajensis]